MKKDILSVYINCVVQYAGKKYTHGIHQKPHHKSGMIYGLFLKLAFPEGLPFIHDIFQR